MNNHQGVRDPLGDPKDGHILTRAIIDTIHEPLIVLDEALRVITASRSFYEKFAVDHKETRDRLFYDLGNGEWRIPALKKLLEEVITDRVAIKDYEVVHDFERLGRRTMLVNAREINYESGGRKLLLSIFDVTKQRHTESELEKVADQKNILLNEMRHRIANSLQMIASILLLKAETVASKDARLHLEDAHSRIMSIATVQQHLDPAGMIEDRIEVGPYLIALCDSLAKSMVGGRKPIEIKVVAGPGTATCDEAISFGLVTTELVINALKYAFPKGEGCIIVTYECTDDECSLRVEDNGIGYEKKDTSTGLGTSIVASLAKQLGAELRTHSSGEGTTISLSMRTAKPSAHS